MTTRRTAAAAVVLALVAVGAGCSDSKPKATPSSTSAPSSSTGAAVSTDPSALEALLLTNVPAGFTQQPDSVGGTGPSTLAKAAKDDGADDAGAQLAKEGFLRGYQRLWENAAGDQIILFVYEFATTDGAKQDFARMHPRLQSIAPPGSVPFAIPGLPPDLSGGVAGSSASLSAAVADFTTGLYNVRIACNGASPDGLQDRVIALALDQAARLTR